MNELVHRTNTQEIASYAQAETAASFVAAEAKAMIEARYVVANRFPRNDDLVRQKLLKECQRSSFANVAIYSKPVGGKKMEGPSIRFAEAILRMMGNVSIDVKVLFDDREKRIVRVTITDYETNYPITQDLTIEKTMERREVKATDTVISSRLNSNGISVHLVEATEDAVATKQAAQVSKAIRSQGLRMVPGDLIDEAMTAVRATQKKTDFQDPDGARNALLDGFAEIGVTAKQLAVWLEHDTSNFSPKELIELRAIFRGIKDGDSTWREVMELKNGGHAEPEADKPRAGKGTEGLAGVLDAKSVKMQTEIIGEEPALTHSDVAAAIKGATNAVRLKAAVQLIAQLPEAVQDDLRSAAMDKAASFDKPVNK